MTRALLWITNGAFVGFIGGALFAVGVDEGSWATYAAIPLFFVSGVVVLIGCIAAGVVVARKP